MADYAISNVPRRVVYAPSGVGPYAFTFEILDQTDIAVYKASALLTLTTDYTVTINTNGTGSVTLVASAGTSNITIVGAKNIQRTTDFTTGGDLFANTLNDELDNQTIFIQQVAETAERGLKAPVTDPTDINMTLPSRTSRAGKTLAFDSIGNPVVGEDIGNWRDDWAAGQSYSVRDIVRDAVDNSIYRCNTAHTAVGSAPIDTNVDAAKWDLIIDGGAVAEAEAAAAAAEAAQDAAETAETNAETAATAAASSASAASTSAGNAATSATNSSNSATAAATSATNASNSATSASTSAGTATTQATNASNSATAAATSATNAANSATAASTSASNASTSATAAAGSATAASGSASTASTQATNAANSATAAATSATNAGNSATAAATSATNASNSATAASTSATNASNSASAASTSAANALTSANNAATSETNAAASASAASTSASTATTQAGAASTSASNASTSASAASTSASNAATSATNAASAQTAAESARDATLAAFDSFDDRYLGSKTSDPTLDNDGNALVAGALYFNSVDGVMKVYTGSAWVAAYVSGAGFLSASNNLSDLANTATARTNLGVAIGTNVQAYDAELQAISGLAANGIIVRTSSSTAEARTITGTTNVIAVTNGDGVSGNPTLTVGSLVARTDTNQSFSVSQRGAITALTDGATITPNMNNANNFSVTLGGNRTLANPTNLTAGQSGVIVITQDGTGSRTLAYGSNFKFPGGTAPTLTTTANSVDVLAYYVESASRITARLVADTK